MSSEFAPSQAEVALTTKIFEKAGSGKLGILTGDVAVNVFSGSKLPASVLGEVWAMADKENNGFLTRKGVATALRLMGHAQRGEQVTEALLSKPGMPPTIDGYTLPILQQNTGGSGSRAKSPPVPALPPLTTQDKAKFMKIFSSCSPVNGMLSGEKAGEVFVKSRLAVEKLSQIWNLADTHKRGSLDSTDFCVAMYLIQACMSGQLSFVPTTLPPGLYDQAAGRSFDSVVAHSTGGSSQIGSGLTASFSSRIPPGPLQPQLTGSQSLQPQTAGSIPRHLPAAPPTLPARPPPTTNAFMQPQSTGQLWDVNPTEKANADRCFDTLDTSKRGYVEGDVVVPFMLQSQLPEDVLAQIWDLADLNNDGHLTREGFAVAMYLIQKKLAGKDIPATIPPTLIPPSMRGKHHPTTAPSPPQESIQDLLWDDTPSSSAIASSPQALQTHRTGLLPAQILQPQGPGPLSPQPTGVQQPVSAASPPPRQFSPVNQDPFSRLQLSAPRDLLGDDDEVTISPPLHDQSAEIGNIQNQLSSTNRALETIKNERVDVERTLAEQAVQLSTLQTQLISAKTAYETETRLLESLRERYATQNMEINKSRQDLITAESDVSAMRVERNEVQGNLLGDKEEVRELQKKMALAGTEIETLKVEIEKAKKDTKQQKGLLAIAKKQLATREAEKAKVERELQEAHAELGETMKEREEAEAELTEEVPPNLTNGHNIEKPSSPDILSMAIAQPLPATPDVVPSPLASVKGKSTNPFDRLASTGTPRSGSPFLSFATSDVPTPTASSLANALADDPFGVSTLFPEVKEVTPPSFDTVFNGTGDSTPTPKAEPKIADAETLTTSKSAAEPDDLFSTPPSSSTLGQTLDGLVSGNPAAGSDAAAVHFPELASPHPPGYFPDVHQTDLNSELKELEAEESDTSDEESDEAVIHQAAIQSVLPNVTTSSAFDDTFGFSSNPVAPASSSATKDTDSTPVIPPESSTTTDLGLSIETAAGKNAFDEAMGTIPGGQPTPANVSFNFDTAFEDNFDFAAAKAETEKPGFPPPRSNTTNGVITIPPASSNNDEFENVFGLQPACSGASPPTASAPNKSMSFDDTFGTGASNVPYPSLSTSISDDHGLSLDSTSGEKRISKAFDDAFAVPRDTSTRQTPSVAFPVASPPASPKSVEPFGSTTSSPSATVQRSASPSPDIVPRHSSSKPRPSTGSSDRLKEPPVRHSRLSIRLPFGRKKKQEHPPIPRPSHLVPTVEDTASDDDIDTVKQLTGMGFSRDEAVAALERNSYDFQRALNSLLGSQ